MKYIKLTEGLSREVGDAEYAAWQDSPTENRPVFLDATDAGVVAYFAAQAEATKLAEGKADELEAIAELTKELLGDKLTKRITEKQEARKKLKANNGKSNLF